MTRKEAQSRLTTALRAQRAAQKTVRDANAAVVEATRRLPPLYVDERYRFAPGERERIQRLIDRAQRASDRLGIATSDVVNARSLVQAQAPSGSHRHQATQKSRTQIEHEIDVMTASEHAIPQERHATKSVNSEYLRKTTVAGQLADDAWLRGGLDAMDAELKSLRRNDADPVIIGEFERLYHKQMIRTLPEQRRAR